MNREIKFRGLQYNSSVLHYGYFLKMTLCDGEGECYYIKSNGKEPVRIKPETLGQFTGLKDKNGKEIYEGDIVKSDYYTGTPGEFKRIIAVAKYHKSSFVIEGINKYEGLRKELHSNSDIIGNIYQNADILTNEK